jgi:hypothetical protein
MSGFWSSDDKIPVRQTKVSIPAENGLNFKSNQVINFMIPSTTQFIQPKETYLRFDVKIDDTTWAADGTQRFQLDKMGGSVVIRDIRIYAGGAGGTLLEEIQGYNVLTGVRYSYEQNESLRNKRSLTEGASQFNPKCRSTFHNTESSTNNVTENPYFDAMTDSVAEQTTAHVSRKVKCLLPLHTGIFQNDKVFPCLLTDGLRIEILLESAPRCIIPLSQVSDNCHLNEKVIFHGLDGLDGGQGAGTNAWDNGGAQSPTEIWVRRDNSQTTAETFPFAIGEMFDFVNMCDDQSAATGVLANTASPILGYTCADGNPMTIQAIQHYPFASSAGGGVAAGGDWGLTKITLVSAATRSAAAANNRVMGGNSEAGAVWVMVSRTLTKASASQMSLLDYELTDVELIVQQLEMPSGYTSKLMKMMKEGGSLNYDFLSYRNYKYSALSGDTQVNMRLPLVESRAKSIICVPTDSSVYTDKTQIQGTPCEASGVVGLHALIGGVAQYTAFDSVEAAKYAYDHNNELIFSPEAAANEYVPNYSQRSGLVGIGDYLTSYQLFYDGKLNPSRLVDCKGVSSGRTLSQQWAIETEKALAMGGIRPLSFRDLHENFIVGRALSLQDGVYDARGKDFNLQLSYEGTSVIAAPINLTNASPTKNKLWNNYCCHLRRLVVRGNAISLEV